MMRDLAVAYRVYPGISRKPAFFSQDKFKLVQLCVASFRRACAGLRVKIWALLDGCPSEYETLFRETFDDDEMEIIRLEAVGNHATFSRQIDLLTKQMDSDFVYFAEDDYFYLPGALGKMIELMRNNPDVDFVSPYDHPDSYNTASRFERHLVKPFGDRYWRTASSTCLTFLTSRENLVRTQSIFRTYCRGNMDCSVWLALTQKAALADPRVHFPSWFRLKIWLRTWRWGSEQILFGKAYRLWVPMPTLATHMESSCLSPLIDWQAAFQNSNSESKTQ
jgi:hypothetical protein